MKIKEKNEETMENSGKILANFLYMSRPVMTSSVSIFQDCTKVLKVVQRHHGKLLPSTRSHQDRHQQGR